MRSRSSLAVLVCVPLLASWSWPTSNDKQVEAGQKAFRAGDFDRAASAFREAMRGDGDSDRVQYDLGTAILRAAMVHTEEDERNAHLDRAIAALRSATDTRNRKLRERALYNLGNALVLRKRYDEAIASYKSVLRSNHDDDDARYNLEFALKSKRASAEQQAAGRDGGAEGEDESTSGQGKSTQDGGGGETAGASTKGAQDGQGGEAAAGKTNASAAEGQPDSQQPAGPTLQAQTNYPDMGTQQERSLDTLTLVQKLEALERRSAELRRRGLLEKSRARLRNPKHKGAQQ